MDVAVFLDTLAEERFFSNQIVHIERIRARKAEYAEVEGGLADQTWASLRGLGIDRLYSHQATAVDLIRGGSNVVVVTGTASGKTLCYTIPTIEAILDDSRATMLYVYPTKALAQDQSRALSSLDLAQFGLPLLAGTYDGDTPQNLRRKIRDSANIVLTNPDMLHRGILPQHPRWNRFLANLRYVVIDEVHAYRGVFGSHLANVVRRLRRICAHYGSDPRLVCTSATIANPQQHAERVTGAEMTLVDNDGAPRGPKRFVLWNPPPIVRGAASGDDGNWRVGGDRRSALREAVELMTALVRQDVQTIAFVRTRLAAELIFRDTRARLAAISPRLGKAVHAYRGGYLPEERREIERKLATKEILGVSSTNALELGIDIGSLDACILVGYPGTIASLWQQAGRAGRGQEESVVFLAAHNAPMDQYLMAHTDYLFAQNPEQAVVDPDNPHIVVGHLKCAAHELPVSEANADEHGPYAAAIMELLEEDQTVRRIDDHWYWSSSEYPAVNVNLRNISGPVYTIQEHAANERVIGTMDEISALSQLHDHAVYLHGAETFFVNKLDLDKKIAFVEARELDYYTQSVQASEIRIDERDLERPCMRGRLGYGDVTVTTSIPMFKKIRFHSRDSLGFEELELPPQTLETVALWYQPPEDVVGYMREEGLLVGDALVGIANVLEEVSPLFVMCDTQDIGTVVDAKNLGADAVFLHDRYPGGMGFARRSYDSFDEVLRTIAEVIRDCACEDGCPSCVGSAVPVSAMSDLDSATRGRIPMKDAAKYLLDGIVQG
jgi:DEAD/DEAH box helicase domain-containing protein